MNHTLVRSAVQLVLCQHIKDMDDDELEAAFKEATGGSIEDGHEARFVGPRGGKEKHRYEKREAARRPPKVETQPVPHPGEPATAPDAAGRNGARLFTPA